MRISTNELDGKTLNMKMFNEESRCYLIYMNVQTRVDMAIVVDEMLNDNRDGIVVTIRCFNGMSLDVSLYSKILQRIRLDGQPNLPFVLYPERFPYAGKSFMVQKIIALNGGVEMVSLYMRCSTEESRCYHYKGDVQWMSRNDIIVHEMFNGGVEMLSLYMRCSMDESRCYRYT
ncbi:hypothetical protein Tco_1569536 [Tanacetum coccineum]